MPVPFWDEYARVQHLVETGKAREEQLNALLSCYVESGQPFDLRDCRRRLKNLARNLARKDRDRRALLKNHVPNSSSVDSPCETMIRRETIALIRSAAGHDWNLVWATIEGNYAAAAAGSGVPVGTVKARVSRCKTKLRAILRLPS